MDSKKSYFQDELVYKDDQDDNDSEHSFDLKRDESLFTSGSANRSQTGTVSHDFNDDSNRSSGAPIISRQKKFPRASNVCSRSSSKNDFLRE